MKAVDVGRKIFYLFSSSGGGTSDVVDISFVQGWFCSRVPSRDSAADKEIRVYIPDDDHNNKNIEHQDSIEKTSSEESVNSLELEETPKKKNGVMT